MRVACHAKSCLRHGHTLLKDASIQDANIQATPGSLVPLESCFLGCIVLDIALDCYGFSPICLDEPHLQRADACMT